MNSEKQKYNSRKAVAFVLIGTGMLWILREWGIYTNLPDLIIHPVLFPLRSFFSDLAHFVFSWQSILILIGLLLLAGKRPVGVALIVAGGIFLLPKILFLPPFSITFILPALLIGFGIAMVTRLL